MSTANLAVKASKNRRIENPLIKYSHWVMILPFLILFLIFIILPIIFAIGLSFTNFNAVETPEFVFFENYSRIFSKDAVFMQKILPNTILYAVIVGPGGYVLAFIMAWLLSQLPKLQRTILAVLLYLPSMTAGTTISTVWAVLFSGDRTGYLNSVFLRLGLIQKPITWLQGEDTLMPIMILVALWSSLGIGFLSILSGILDVNPELYEAGAIDGIRTRWHELWFITMPSMKTILLFSAVMQIQTAFSMGALQTTLAGYPSVSNSVDTLVQYIGDVGTTRYEMGYAAAVSVVLLLMVFGFSKFFGKMFKED